MPTTNPNFDPQAVQVIWTVIQGLGTLGLGVVGVFIARQNVALGKQNIEITKQNAAIAERNMAVTEQKSRLENFAKRWDVYVAVSDFLKKTYDAADVDWEHIEGYTKATRTAGFLFYPEVAAFIDEVRQAATDLHVTCMQIRSHQETPEKHHALIHQNDSLLHKLLQHKQRVDFVFDPYLESRPTVRPPVRLVGKTTEES
jgi:predicted NAD-dependent protein-ADP-ribosyltransferase YbiA (DUF1768 family)